MILQHEVEVNMLTFIIQCICRSSLPHPKLDQVTQPIMHAFYFLHNLESCFLLLPFEYDAET